MSIFKAKFPPKIFLLRTFITSDVKQIQSLILLLLINPLCCVEIIVGINVESLSAKILKISLNLKFAMEMDLWSDTEVAWLVLGISTILLELKLGKIQPVLKKSMTAFET